MSPFRTSLRRPLTRLAAVELGLGAFGLAALFFDYTMGYARMLASDVRPRDPYAAWQFVGAAAMLAMNALILLAPVFCAVLVYRRWKTEPRGELLADAAIAVLGVPLLVWTLGHALNAAAPWLALHLIVRRL